MDIVSKTVENIYRRKTNVNEVKVDLRQRLLKSLFYRMLSFYFGQTRKAEIVLITGGRENCISPMKLNCEVLCNQNSHSKTPVNRLGHIYFSLVLKLSDALESA